jgi:hypothetical protein
MTDWRNLQRDWRWCHRCEGLFFAGNPSQGQCPAPGGGPHEARESAEYGAILGGGSAPAGRLPQPSLAPISAQQGDWRWCHRCEGLFFAGNPSQGQCPAPGGGPHEAGPNGHYAVLFDDGVGQENAQNGWRWCHRCEGLFFAGNPSQGQCPAPGGGPHEARESGAYKMEFYLPIK